MVEERKLAVLRAIVEDYVATSEPVGSKALVERHHLGVSPATVRNDMAALEDEGYITQPHTSAGRVPTDTGYRLFVDRLSTGQAAVVGGAPRDSRLPRRRRRPRRRGVAHGAAARAADPAGRRRAVPVADPVEGPARGAGRRRAQPADGGGDHQHRTGRAAGHRLAAALDEDSVADLRTRLNQAATGKLLTEVPDALDEVVPAFGADVRPAVTAVVTTLLETLVEETEERLVLAAPPTSRCSEPTSAAASSRCSRRWRSRWSCCTCSVRCVAVRGQRADRARASGRGPHRHLGGHHVATARRPPAGSAWSARPAWTTRARWQRSRSGRYVGQPPGGASRDRLLRRTRRGSRRLPGRDQAGLPQARPRAAPGRQPPDRRSGSRRSPPRTRCCRTRRSGSSTTSAVTRRRASGGFGGLRGLRRHHGRLLRQTGGARAAGRGGVAARTP